MSEQDKQIIQNPMRIAGFWEKVICRLRSPLNSIPEGKPLTTFRESVKYGYDALGFRLIAESLAMGVQYTVHSAVEGDIAEFGTHTGRTGKVLAASMKLYRPTKKLIFFDSFEGMPEATHPLDLENEHVKLGVWGKGQFKGVGPEELRDICGKYIGRENVMTYKGWFSDTMPKLPKGSKFAMMHIDCDFYSSALDVLDYVFKNNVVSEGALIYFDDWDCHKASPHHGERKAWAEVVQKYKVNFSDMGGYAWAGHKFVVHDYSA